MKTIETQIVIEAPPSKVWGILTDFPAMSAWNPLHADDLRIAISW